MREYSKSKTAAKIITYESTSLKKVVLDTVAKASALVGSTLGPNGKVVLIERQENLPPFTSKDGITVFKSMAFANSTAQAVLEAARDSSSKTNVEAGDGPVPKYTKVLTPKGFVEMGDVKVGMEICGTDGTIQKVLGVFPKGKKEIYEVEFENKGVIECCKDHLWSVTCADTGKTKTAPLSELMTDYVKDKGGYPNYKYYTPRTHVEFYENTAEMPLDPYLVGVLLGDGSLRESGSIELSLGIAKKHILDKLQVPDGISVNTSFVSEKNYYRVKLSGCDSNGKSIKDIMRSIGLFNTTSHTKFIPKSYLYASKESREKLLQGLIDTDGHINSRGRFEFSTVSEELANDFCELAKSLGKALYRRVQIRSKLEGSYSDTPVHRINELKGYKNGDKIIRIAPTGKFTEMQCIKVSNDNNLYVMDNYVVTHNTTSATILAEALIRLGFEYLEKNPHLSTQKVMRELENAYKNEIVPFIKGNSLKITNDNDSDLLRKVSMIATNHDEEMTDSVIEAFDLVGHNGQITISEVPGGMGYGVEKIEGFPIARGFEDSCGRFIEEFINDKSNYRTVLEKPHFLLYNGKITEPSALIPILQQLENAVNLVENPYSPNLVIVAHHFSDTALAFFAQNFKNPSSFNILPLKTPMTQQANSQYHFLQDLAAFTGSAVLDPLNKNLESAELEDLGKTMSTFEYYRYKSILLGDPDEFLIISRSKELEQQAKHAESDLDAELLKERAAILTGGIARIKVFGSSESELKEKAHRVEDAVMAIKGALREGVLPGCGKTLLTLSIKFSQSDKESLREIMAKAFMAPFVRIFVNGGYNPKEIQDLHKEVVSNQDFWYTYDALNHKYGNAIELGIVDSASAVLMSVKNSLSVAKMLMGLSGIVVFKRDNDLDAEESKSYSSEQEAMKQALADSDKQKFEPEF